jgi:aryl-phospho-beta-D-glucosidase BglC (GH1 family)
MRVVRLSLALVFVLTACVHADNFFRRSGSQILDPDGQPFLVRGNALSHWLTPEAYALKLNTVHGRHIGSYSSIRARIREILGNDADADAFWAAYHSNFVTQADLNAMAAEGFNTIRIPFNYRLLSPENTPGVFSEAGFQILDQAIQMCKNSGLAVILDMHACPGGQSHDAPADPEYTYWTWDAGIQNWVECGVATLWEFDQGYYNLTGRTPEFNKQRTAAIWREIAARYAHEPAVIGYELINEPFLPYGVHYPDLRALFMQITAAIREVDTNHIIFVEGNFYAGTFDGLVPPWDDNMALCFHRYWDPVNNAMIESFINAAAPYNLPIVMTESGENSNQWFHEFVTLLEANNIGWCWWGYKKVDMISSAFSATITPDYQYVIDNFRDLPIDAARAKTGLMECAANLATDACDFDPGWFDALLSPSYASSSCAFVNNVIPGTIYCVNYDVGHQGVAFFDGRYKNEDGFFGGPWNEGDAYRNDGVDITTTGEGIGYKVGWTENGEWLKFTVNITQTGRYDINIRTATPNNGGKLRLYLNGSPITSEISVPRSNGWENWRTTTLRNVNLTAGTRILELRVVAGGFDIASVEFKKK